MLGPEPGLGALPGVSLLAELHEPLLQAHQDQRAQLLALVVQPEPLLVVVGGSRGGQEEPGRPVAGLGEGGGVAVERLAGPGERLDVRPKGRPVRDEQGGELRCRLVQPEDRSLERGAVRGERAGDRVVGADQPAERRLSSGQRYGQLVEFHDQLRQIVSLGGERLHHARPVLDQPIQVGAGALQDGRRVLDERGHGLRVDRAEVVLERTKELVGFGGDGGSALRDGRSVRERRSTPIGREELDEPFTQERHRHDGGLDPGRQPHVPIDLEGHVHAAGHVADVHHPAHVDAEDPNLHRRKDLDRPNELRVIDAWAMAHEGASREGHQGGHERRQEALHGRPAFAARRMNSMRSARDWGSGAPSPGESPVAAAPPDHALGSTPSDQSPDPE